MNRVPYVFVLDWDGTIAGRVDFQSQAFTIRAQLKKLGIRPKIQIGSEQVPRAFTPSSKLIRPGFANFISALKQYFGEGNVYFFIYTASERQWALQEIAWMERAFNIRFERPIFTRDDCIVDAFGNYKKSLGRIYPRICRAISKGRSLTKQEKLYILENQLLIIDNNAVYTDRSDKLLICPDYNYTVFENLTEIIPREAVEHHEVKSLIYSLMNMGLVCPKSNKEDIMDHLTYKYSWLANKCKSINESNVAYAHDDFWKFLKSLIVRNELKRFNSNIIKQLQDAVWKRTKMKK